MVSALAAIKVMVVVLLAMAAPVLVVYGSVKLLQGLFWVLGGLGRGIQASLRSFGLSIAALARHLWRFARGMVVDSLRTFGAMLTAAVILPLALLNLCLGRWRAAGHYGEALEDELGTALGAAFQVLVGHPVRFLGLGLLTDGIERRVPELVARAPEPRARRRRPGHFEGYDVKGNLPPGGSGALLYLARPRREKLEALMRAGHPDPGDVVIKAFELGRGSTLPQIVRESRALEAASRLGLVLEHELTDASFHYVMPYVPGERLDQVITSMHARAGESGLRPRDFPVVIGYASDLLQTLDRFHTGGLWHKDIKPGNLIVSNQRVQLVDLGLVTPLQSAMTLTTHGTEYFRDPEMVRLALKGVKVHEVDGAKFDLYSAGAVLYAMIENSFPAHGSLSRIEKRCPEALRWIVRRSMAEMSARYAQAWEMLADLRVLMAAKDPFAVRPAELPSLAGGQARLRPEEPEPFLEPLPQAAAPDLPRSWKGEREDPTPVALDPASGRGRHRRARRGLLVAGLSLVGATVVLGSIMTARGYFSFLGDSHPIPPPRILLPTQSAMPSPPGASVWSAQQAAAQALLVGDAARWREGRPDWAPGFTPHLLLLEDLPAGADRSPLQDFYSRLSEEGYVLLGGRGAEEDAQTLELEAGARKAVGLGLPGDADAIARLEEHLSGQAEVDAVLWITQSPGEGMPRFLFVPRPSSRDPRYALRQLR